MSGPQRIAQSLSRAPASLIAALAIVSALLTAGTTSGALAQQPPARAERASVVVVLDGSNSMNARLPNDRQLKFATVRDAMRASIPKLTSGTEIGLAAFGARRANDCNDAELLVPPSRDGNQVLGALETFQPRGFSPVVLALRTAARALPADATKASIVLVVDDLASCRSEDPCAVATDLKRQFPALAIHVVGLALRPADTQVLACVARQTGGQLINAPDGQAVGGAIEQALTLSALERPAVPAPQRVPEIVARPELARPRPAATASATTLSSLGIDLAKPGLHLTARLTAGTPTLFIPIQWRIFRSEASGSAETNQAPEQRAPTPVVEAMAPALSRILPAGRYDVEATADLVTVRRTIEIADQGPIPIAIDLNAAMLTMSASQAKALPPLTETTLTVLAVGASNTPLWIGRTGSRDLVVPTGSYRIKATAGLAAVERVLTVGAGVVGDVQLPLAAGRLVVEDRMGIAGAVAASPDGPRILLETDDPNSSGGLRELYRTAAGRLDVMLPAGAYLLTLRQGAAETRERVQIRAGETLTRPFAQAPARIRLVSRIGNGLPQGLGVAYRIERLDSAMRPVQLSGEAEPAIELMPGRYRFEARVGMQNAVAVRDVDIRSSTTEQRVDLDTGSGGIRLQLTGVAPGLGLGEVYWQVFTDRGETVWRTGITEPVLALEAGRYRVRAESRDRSAERSFDVRAGDNRVVEVGG